MLIAVIQRFKTGQITSYNLVTKRAVCDANATMEWIDGNIGSKLTMKYPAVILKGEGARGLTFPLLLLVKDNIKMLERK